MMQLFAMLSGEGFGTSKACRVSDPSPTVRVLLGARVASNCPYQHHGNEELRTRLVGEGWLDDDGGSAFGCGDGRPHLVDFGHEFCWQRDLAPAHVQGWMTVLSLASTQAVDPSGLKEKMIDSSPRPTMQLSVTCEGCDEEQRH